MRGVPLRIRLACCALVITCASGVVIGQDLWYRSYQDGVQAFNSGNFPDAATKLLAALNNRLAPKTRGRTVLYYGQLRGEFLPEYYLARAYAGQQRWDEALKYAKLAEAYLKASDAEYPKLVAARGDAEKGLASATLAASNVPPRTPPGAASPPPSRGNPPAVDPAILARRDFDRLAADVDRFAAAGQFTQARQSATAAKALGADNARADELLKTIDVQDVQAQIGTQLRARSWAAVGPLVDRLAVLDPTNPLIRSARQETTKGLADNDGKRLEREGLTAFYRGQYQQALDTLGRVSADVKTPRVVFYQACSTAALGLIQGDKAKLQRAHELFLQAKPKENSFAVDRKYVSPRVVKVLDSTSP